MTADEDGAVMVLIRIGYVEIGNHIIIFAIIFLANMSDLQVAITYNVGEWWCRCCGYSNNLINRHSLVRFIKINIYSSTFLFKSKVSYSLNNNMNEAWGNLDRGN